MHEALRRTGRSSVDVQKKHTHRNKGPSKPYEFIGSGATAVTKPYKFIWFGAIHGPKPYEFMGFRWAFISQTPVMVIMTEPWPSRAGGSGPAGGSGGPGRSGDFAWSCRVFCVDFSYVCFQGLRNPYLLTHALDLCSF